MFRFIPCFPVESFLCLLPNTNNQNEYPTLPLPPARPPALLCLFARFPFHQRAAEYGNILVSELGEANGTIEKRTAERDLAREELQLMQVRSVGHSAHGPPT